MSATPGTIRKIAWLCIEDGRVLSTRNHGLNVWYLPGGKPEPGETDTATLVREIAEETRVVILPDTAQYVGMFSGPAHNQPDGVQLQMACYTAEHRGTPRAAREVAEVMWLSYADRDRVSSVDATVFAHLHACGLLS